MNDDEKKLSDYIDQLNAERKPDAHAHEGTDADKLQELYQAARMVRNLREPAMPDAGFAHSIARSLQSATPAKQAKPRRNRKWGWLAGGVSAAAALLLLFNIWSSMGSLNVVHAMEQAYEQMGAYHATLDIMQNDADGNAALQSKIEVWADSSGRYYTKGLAGYYEDFVTVNNGTEKWQVQPDHKEVHRFAAFPDTYRFQFELGNEVTQASQAASTKIIGDDMIAGRQTTVLEVTPDGGLPYRIWIDKETDLPLQKQTALQHAIQYTMTYSTIEFAAAIPAELLAYEAPQGYAEIDNAPEQAVADLNEAASITGFFPATPEPAPKGYTLDHITVISGSNAVKLYYRSVDNSLMVVEQKTEAGELAPSSAAMIGELNGDPVELLPSVDGSPDASSVRWQQNGFEWTVTGQASLEGSIAFAETLMNGTLEQPEQKETSQQPQIEVPYDLEVEKNEQQNADAGSSPWKLDPVFVAQVFVSLQMSPEGITGDYPVAYESLEIILSNGEEAIVQVNDEASPVKNVYLNRLIRQDETGIWTVVGYDPA